MKTVSKYLVYTMILFTFFIVVSGCTINQSFGNKQNANKTIRVVAVGDNLIHPVVYKDAQITGNSFDFKPMYQPVRKDIQNADISFVNQESPLGGDDRPYSGFKNFNTPSSIAQDLVDTGFNFINGANNHALDQGEQGVRNHIHTWNKFKDQVLFTGVYESEQAHRQIPIKTIKGVKVALLSYTFGTNDHQPTHDYTVDTFDENKIKQDVKKAKQQSDVVLVSAHWGNEGKHQPNATQKKYAQIFADAGVDVVLGTHPHVIQPVKWVDGREGNRTLVAYSLGNFLNGQSTGNESNDLLGRIDFKISKKDKQFQVQDVKWRSMVNYYELTQHQNQFLKSNFKVMMLDDYNDKDASHHGRNQMDSSSMSPAHLRDITRSVIDKQYLDNRSL